VRQPQLGLEAPQAEQSEALIVPVLRGEGLDHVNGADRLLGNRGERTVLAARIRERAIAWAVGASDAFEIDHYNILEASRRAMKRAIAALSPACDYLLIDAVKLAVDIPQRGLIHGDARSFSIAAASILAKTARDAALASWDAVFPGFGLASNKGYSTPDHIAALRTLGPTPLHRFSFEPVRLSTGREDAWTGYPIKWSDRPAIQEELFA